MQELVAIAEKIAARLIARRQTIAVAESSTGGLISAALLAVPGASAYFLGSAVVYTRDARRILMDIPDEAMKGIRSASETYAKLLATQIRQRFSTDWGLSDDRGDRTDWQPLWRRRRPQLHGGRGPGAVCDDARDRQQRPPRQHARVRLDGAQSSVAESVALKIAGCAAPFNHQALRNSRFKFQTANSLAVPSLRANGSRECAPDDRLREAIQNPTAATIMDCFVRCAPRNDVALIEP
jgi:hypothetical protein